MKVGFKILLTLVLSSIVLLTLLLGWGYSQSPIEPQDWDVSDNPGFTGDFFENNELARLQVLAPGIGIGPEDTAVSSDGAIYTGVVSGKVFRVDPENGEAILFADTSGRPLGMEFDQTGNLIVADAVRGLLSISPDAQVSTLIGPDALGFADDLDIAQDGTIWLSNASTRYGYEQTLFSFMEGDTSGSLLSYNPMTGKLTEQISNLFFANGVTLGPNESYVLVSETGRGRVHRLWLAGEHAGKQDVFIDGLPAMIDNISFNGHDTVWLALPSKRDDRLSKSTLLRKALSGLPSHWWLPEQRFGFILGFNLDGELTHNFQNSAGMPVEFSDITSVQQANDKLYIGSLVENSLGVLELSGY